MKIPGQAPLWMSGAYFAFYAGIACWGPYAVLYYQQIGLNGAEIGIVNAIPPLGMAFMAPFWGYVADSRNAHRMILRIALMTTAIVALLMANATGFWHVLPLILLLALIGTTSSPLIDSYGVTISAQYGLNFGQLRVWGSIGYTMVVWLIGAAMGGAISHLFLYGYALALGATFMATIGLPPRRQQSSQTRWQGAAGMLRMRPIQIILLVVFLLAIGTNPVFALFGIYIKQLGGDTALLGASSAIAAISEFPVMFLGNRLVKSLGSRRMLIVALSIYCLRIFLLTIIPSAPWVLGVQVLHGFSFGLYLMASISLVHELVDPRLTATAQGLLASAMAFGQMGGSLIGGVLLDRMGMVVIYRISVVLVLFALAVFVLGMRWYAKPAIKDA